MACSNSVDILFGDVFEYFEIHNNSLKLPAHVKLILQKQGYSWFSFIFFNIQLIVIDSIVRNLFARVMKRKLKFLVLFASKPEMSDSIFARRKRKQCYIAVSAVVEFGGCLSETTMAMSSAQPMIECENRNSIESVLSISNDHKETIKQFLVGSLLRSDELNFGVWTAVSVDFPS